MLIGQYSFYRGKNTLTTSERTCAFEDFFFFLEFIIINIKWLYSNSYYFTFKSLKSLKKKIKQYMPKQGIFYKFTVHSFHIERAKASMFACHQALDRTEQSIWVKWGQQFLHFNDHSRFSSSTPGFPFSVPHLCDKTPLQRILKQVKNKTNDPIK